jgi:UPF0716 protein FxsA
MILLAGLLLLLPGFVTDVVGLLLFIPPVRDFVWNQLRRRLAVTSLATGFGRSRRRSRDGRTIDLDAEDFHRTPGPNSPWRIGTR